MRFPHSPKVGLRLLAGAVLVAGLSVAVTSAASASQPHKQFTATDLSSKVISTFTGAKSDSGRLAKTDPSLLGKTDATPVNVMIKYDFDSVASYQGGSAGYPATSPGKTGKKVKDNRAAADAYRAHIGQSAFEIANRVQATIPGANVHRPYLNVYGGASATVPANSIAALLKVPGVVAVQRDALRQPQDDNTAFIGATAVWPSIGGSSAAASNVTIGVIDTGIWPEHPMMSAVGEPPPTGAIADCQFGDGSDTANLGPTFACNNKLIGAYAETDTYMANTGAGAEEFCNSVTLECSARDSEGHGTHTTTTSSGRCVTSAVLYGVQRGPVCGIAPGAHVIMYRVCMAQGCFASDSVASVDQAIIDGVDVINFSISGGAQPYSDPVELAFLDATNAGISVNASAGNSGPGAATSDHGGPWTTTVGASTGPRSFTTTLHLTAVGGDTFDMDGFTLTNGISPSKSIVLAQDIAGEDSKCQTPLTAGQATGKVVLCMRGTNARVDKGFNVLQGGAAGMILYNAVQQDVETDNHWLPAIHVDGPDTALLAFISGHTGVKASWSQGTATATQADVMASFSSRGPLGDWIKPDVTAPGVQVLAGMTPQPDQTTPTNGPSGNLYQAIAGTSMSSPHSAGVSALVKSAHPDWTPEEIKSALMTSSVQNVLKEDYSTPATPFDRGAGSIRADRAVNPTLVFDSSYEDFVAAGGDPLNRIDLNLASIDAPVMSGLITTMRTATNVTGKSQTLNVYTQAPEGADIIVSTSPPKGDKLPKTAKSIKFDSKKPTSFYVTINAPALANGQYFGQIQLGNGNAPARANNSGNVNPVVIPVAFKKGQGAVSLTNTCSPTTVAVNQTTECSAVATNLSTTPAEVNMAVDGTGKLTFSNVQFPVAKKPSNSKSSGNHIEFAAELSPTIAPTVDSIADITGDGPDGGYLALSLFSVPAVAGVGDDTITNFNVPTFYYGGEPYTRIGVVSNGYIVVGGGTSSDIVYSPQDFPDSDGPNNVLAPLWSDLNPAGAGAIRVATLSGGGYGWIVIDYDGVKNFGNATTHSFEVWLQQATGAAGTGPESEAITYSYGPNLSFPGDGPGLANAASGDPDSGQNWGAENRDGASGVNISPAPADGSEWAVMTSDPTPGGSAEIDYDASAKVQGSYQSIASMTSNVTKGTTKVVQNVLVQNP